MTPPPTAPTPQPSLTTWVNLELTIRRLVGIRLERGPDDRRDRLLMALVATRERLGRAGWN